MKGINVKILYPHLLVVVLFFGLTLVFFSPLFEGKDLRQMDMTHAKGMSRELVKYKEQTGNSSQWTNSMFGGMPAYQIMGSQENNIFKYLTNVFRFNLPVFTVAILFTFFLGFYILLLSLKFDTWLSFIGSVAFGLASYNISIIEVGHVTKGYAIAFMPLVLAGIFQVFRSNYLIGLVLTTIALGLEIYANHVQITYYLFLMILVMLLVYFIYAIRSKSLKDFFKKSMLLFIATVLAILPNISHLWTTYEYGKVTLRGPSELKTKDGEKVSSGLDQDYAFSWSYGKAETGTLLIPYFMGGSSSESLGENSTSYNELQDKGIPNAASIVENLPMYWGGQPFTSGPVYLGAIVCFLFVIGLFLIKGPEKWWLLAATILSIVLSWGRNFPAFNGLLFDYFPLYNKFRTVAMTLVIAGFTVPLLGFMALKKIMEVKKPDKKIILNAVKKSFIIVGGFTLFFALMPGLFFDFVSGSDEQLQKSGYPDWLINAIRIDRKGMLISDSWRSFIFISLSAGIIWAYLADRLQKKYVYLAFSIFMLADFIPIGKRYLTKEDFSPRKELKEAYYPTAADMEILRDKDPDYRVFNMAVNPFADVSTSYFHKSIGGYHGAKLRRYQDLYEHQISKQNMSVLNMLNTKYFIVPDEQKQPIAQYNPNALGNAWFVNEYKLVDNADEELNALSDFNPSKTAIIDNHFEKQLTALSKQNANDTTNSDKIKLMDYKPNHLTYQANSASNRLAVFSEIYYEKGWNAYVDGILQPHFRVNYVLRSMIIPKGNHKIEFKFEPVSFYLGQKISLAGSILIVLLVGWVIIKIIRKPSEPAIS